MKFPSLTGRLLIAVPGIAQEKEKKKRRANALSPTSRLMMRMQALREATETLGLTAEHGRDPAIPRSPA